MTTQYGVYPPVGGSQPLAQSQFENVNPIPLTVTGGVVKASLPLSAVAAGANQAKVGLSSVADGLLALLTTGDLSEATSSVLTITSGTGKLVGGNASIQVKQASTSQAGYLSSTDWNTFNDKVPTTRTISTTAPLAGGGDLSANRTLSIQKATGSLDGYLAASDFAIFNAKEPAITASTSTTYYRGDKSFVTLNQAAVAGLTTADSPTFTGVTSTNLTLTGKNGVVKAASGVVSASTIVDADISASAAINISKIAVRTPTIQRLVSGSGTYTTPSSPAPLYIRVKALGGGGGGGGSGSSATTGVAGTATTFGSSLISCGAGGPGTTSGAGGSGGVVSVAAGPILVIGMNGCIGPGSNSTGSAGGAGSVGASSMFGGAGGTQYSSAGGGAVTNSGSGGGGGGISGVGYTGAGGGTGAYAEVLIYSPAASYPYAIGTGGTGGAAGGSGATGGNGGSGIVIVEEYYQ